MNKYFRLNDEQLKVFRYLIAVFCVFLFNFLVYYLCSRYLLIPVLISNVITWILSVIFAYILNYPVVKSLFLI